MITKKLLTALAAIAITSTATAQTTPPSQMELLDRGVVALTSSTGKGNFISWRFLGTDDETATTFDVIRNTTVVARNLYATNYTDAAGTTASTYRIVTKIDGEAVDTTEAVKTWGDVYWQLKLDRPAKGAQGGTYEPNDMSVGDVDGDGQYELFVKWYPSNAKDNSQSGITDNTIIDCYKVDWSNQATNSNPLCQRLWRIDLGRNIRSGAHYTQFMVYDFNGDGRAEMMCKTGPGSLDGTGAYVNSVATDATIRSVSGTSLYRSSDGRITGGQEWLTVFDGLTGKAIHTIFYNPNRNMTYGGEADGSVNWGDVDGKNDKASYGNRGERFLAAVAHLDGPNANPSAIFSRGYYGYAFIWAVDFDGNQLHQKWLSSHKSKTAYTLTTYDSTGKGTSKTYSGFTPTFKPGSGEKSGGSATMFGNGNHNLSVADVDGDGCDEILWGSAALNNDGSLLYGTGFGHGDAIHLAMHNPNRPGMQVFQVHEDKGTYAWDLHDAATGEILLKGGPAGVDNGRGIAAQFDAAVRGSLFWSSSDGSARSAISGEVISAQHGSSNFRIYWDGDLQEELFDGGKIDKWNGSKTDRLYLNTKNLYDYNASSTCNGTKSTPCLQADLFGDWREEVILWSTNDYTTLNIFTTNTETKYRIPTLMHDHTYRMGIAWQNTAYNQPPHLGYYLPDAMQPSLACERELTLYLGEEMAPFEVKARYVSQLRQSRYLLPDGTSKAGMPAGLVRTNNTAKKTITLSGTPTEAGIFKLLLNVTSLNGVRTTDTLTVNILDTPSGISPATSSQAASAAVYDLQGRRRLDDATQPASNRHGLYIVRRNGKTLKELR